MVGGIIAAANNGKGSVGVAWSSEVTGINYLGNSSAKGIVFSVPFSHFTNFDIVNNSWGMSTNKFLTSYNTQPLGKHL